MAPDAQPQPRPPERLGPAAALALLVHAALIVGLAVSVDWRSSEPEAVSAELWAAVPQVAAPPPAPQPPAPEPKPEPRPEPKPAPPPPAPPKAAPDRDAEIATERAERRKREEEERAKRELAEKRAAEKRAADEAEKKKREQAEAEAERRKLEAQKRAEQQKLAQQQKAEAQRLEKLRQEQLQRMQSSLGGVGTGSPGSTGSAPRSAGPGGPSSGYGAKLRSLIRENTVFTESVSGNPVAEVEVRAGPTGTIIARRLVKSSGVPAWDEAVLRAIDRIGTLPRDVDGRVPPTIVITARPKD